MTIPEPADPVPFVVAGPEGLMTLFAMLTKKALVPAVYEKVLSADTSGALDALAREMESCPDNQRAVLKRQFEVVVA